MQWKLTRYALSVSVGLREALNFQNNGNQPNKIEKSKGLTAVKYKCIWPKMSRNHSCLLLTILVSQMLQWGKKYSNRSWLR